MTGSVAISRAPLLNRGATFNFILAIRPSGHAGSTSIGDVGQNHRTNDHIVKIRFFQSNAKYVYPITSKTINEAFESTYWLVNEATQHLIHTCLFHQHVFKRISWRPDSPSTSLNLPSKLFRFWASFPNSFLVSATSERAEAALWSASVTLFVQSFINFNFSLASRSTASSFLRSSSLFGASLLTKFKRFWSSSRENSASQRWSDTFSIVVVLFAAHASILP